MSVVSVETIDVRSVLDRLREINLLPVVIRSLAPVPPEVPLANHLCVIASPAKHVSHGRAIGRDQVIAGSTEYTFGKPRSPVVAAGENSIASWRANGAGRVSVEERDAFVRHLLQVRCLNLAVWVRRRYVADTKIVCENINDVRPGTALGHSGALEDADQCQSQGKNSLVGLWHGVVHLQKELSCPPSGAVPGCKAVRFYPRLRL